MEQSTQQSLYFTILRRLAEAGVKKEISIDDLFEHEFLTPNVWFTETERIDLIVEYLKIIEDNGHIKFTNHTKPVFDTNTDPNKPRVNKWIKPIEITAEITLKGLEYIRDYEVRDETVRSLKSQRNYVFVTWGISLAAILGTIGMGIYSTNHTGVQKQQLDSLRQEINQLKIQKPQKVLSHKNLDTIVVKIIKP
ncbi:MAG: hypothetical protein JST50_02110 [Bacteroidetes bacterium]|jgi:hypothetical protein|nr:hypothetical protein [Bacteroidota bacterium]